jgi:heme-degrading monooxygenase HmoA
MSVIRFARFHVEPTEANEMLMTRAALIDGIRQRFSGLTEARLTRVDARTYVDVWRWNSRADLDQALEAGPTVAEAPAVFALLQELTTEDADVVDER